jgi:hypothetical protein
LEIGVHVLKGEIEDCQPVTLPVLPPNVNNPLVEPEQIVVPEGVMLPATVVGFTVTVRLDDVPLAQELAVPHTVTLPVVDPKVTVIVVVIWFVIVEPVGTVQL